MKKILFTLILSLNFNVFANEATVLTGRYSIMIEDRLKNSENIIQINQASQFPFKEGEFYYVSIQIKVTNKIPKVFIENQELPAISKTSLNNKKNEFNQFVLKYKIKKAQEKIYIKLINAQGKELTTLDQKDICYLSDISKMPSIIAKLFAIPKMRKYEYNIGLDRDGVITKDIPSKEKMISILSIKQLKIENTQYVNSQEELKKIIQNYLK